MAKADYAAAQGAGNCEIKEGKAIRLGAVYMAQKKLLRKVIKAKIIANGKPTGKYAMFRVTQKISL